MLLISFMMYTCQDDRSLQLRQLAARLRNCEEITESFPEPDSKRIISVILARPKYHKGLSKLEQHSRGFW